MPPVELALETLIFQRNEGADLAGIRHGVEVRGGKAATAEHVRAALERLEAEGQVTRVGKKWFPTPAALKNAPRPPWPAEFRFEDEWILLALMYDQEHAPSPRDRIIAFAYGINRCIPKIEEMHGALNRLATAGLIGARNGSFELRKKGRDLHAKLKTRPNMRAIADDVEALGALLRCPCCGPRLTPIRWKIPLTERDYKAALQKYSRGA